LAEGPSAKFGLNAMPRVLLNFDHHRDGWNVHFMRDDCRSRIGSRTRYFKFPALHDLRSFVERCQPKDVTLVGFDHSVRAWNRGSEYVNLTDEQYAKVVSGLERPSNELRLR